MRVHALPISAHVAAAMRRACIGGHEVRMHRDLQSFGSALFREPMAVGVFWSGGAAKAAETVRGWRQGDVNNPLLALLPSHACKPQLFASVLWAGADDVQKDALHPEELLGRCLALYRRQQDRAPEIHNVLGCSFNVESHVFWSDAGEIHFTRMEGEILAMLVVRPETVITKQMIMSRLYLDADCPDPKIIDVVICKIRRKLAPLLGGLDVLETVWGRGYQYVPSGFEPPMAAQRRRVG